MSLQMIAEVTTEAMEIRERVRLEQGIAPQDLTARVIRTDWQAVAMYRKHGLDLRSVLGSVGDLASQGEKLRELLDKSK